MTQPISILIAALGGEGGGMLAEWLVDVAARAGYPVQSTSIPGVAQRTGATTYYVEVYPEPLAALGTRRPILSLLPVPGSVDLVVASELLEAARTIQTGMVSAERTVLIASSSRTLTTTEKLPLGDGRFDTERLLEVARATSRELRCFDMAAAAREAGTAISAVMLGAIAASGVLPFGRAAFETVIRDSHRGVEASLAGFALGWDALRAAAASATPAQPHGERGAASMRAVSHERLARLPAPVREIAEIGHQRLVDYQDRAYAGLYVDRLERIAGCERAADPQADHGFAMTRECARFLALWMAFDDTIRVADLKIRASRFARVRREVGAAERDVVRIVDYFRPGVPELATLLPHPLSRRLAAWERRRVMRGHAPFTLRLALRSDGVWGFLALRTLAQLKWLRRSSARFAAEQALIERWLDAIATATRASWSCGHELALAGRLIKGYGATNERGKENLIWIIERLGSGGTVPTAEERAAAIREAREAALADEAGTALDVALVRHGAPPRPVKAQPIVWSRSARKRDAIEARPPA